MVLQEYVDNVNVPSPTDKIYKDECVYSFDRPELEDGLYVCLNTFFGVGKKFLALHYERTRSPLYLHLRKIRIEKSPSPNNGDEVPNKITKLAIGVEGGFNKDPTQETIYEDIHSLYLYPSMEFYELSDPELPEKIVNSVVGILSSESAVKLEEIQNAVQAWDGEQKIVTKYADLKQLDNGKHIPPTGWKCEMCDKTDNLWLNLTDGTILCGRRNFDGSGGNNHAFEYYEKTKYPLAVKLGTITPQGADVYSYPEDDMVENPNLRSHLAHFGINVDAMEKTEKTMIELEIEMNQRLDEWLTIQESNSQLKPLFGPGYTGLENLEFAKYYLPAEDIFRTCKNIPDNFNFQMAKLANGLLLGDYSIAPSNEEIKEQPGIKPRTFKQLVGRGHPEFSTKRQQDALEFFLHIINMVERNSLLNKCDNPVDCFKFELEDRLQCNASKKVNYSSRAEYFLSLPIPMDKALNLEQVIKYEEAKRIAQEAGEKLPDVVRSQIRLVDCISAFSQTEEITDFMSPVTKTKTTAHKSLKIKSFPDFLMIQLKKFVLDNDWQPKKLDVSLELPDVLDLSSLRSQGPAVGEEIFTNEPDAVEEIVFDQDTIAQLADMGFSENACKRALIAVKSNNIEQALNWLFDHQQDADLNSNLVTGNKQNVNVDPASIEMLLGMGINEPHARKSLQETNGSVERAIEWYFSHQDELTALDIANETASSVDVPNKAAYRDGKETYRLFAFISHMGSSTLCGHYVCHVRKDDKWVIFNDNKVAESENPPKELAYLYLYKRI